MTFSAPFSRVITRPFGGVPSSAWWLSGGIAAANCVAAYQAKGAASLAASYVNLANPGTYDCTTTAAPALDATDGWQFNGSKLLATGMTIGSTSYSMIVRFTNASAGACFGALTGANQASYIAPNYDGSNHRVANCAYKTIATAYSAGVFGFAGQRFFVNGTYEAAVDAGTAPTAYVFIGSWNGAANYKGNIQALAIYNATITDPQMAALTTAMNAL